MMLQFFDGAQPNTRALFNTRETGAVEALGGRHCSGFIRGLLYALSVSR